MKETQRNRASPYLSPKEAGVYLRVSESTLAHLRRQGGGPAYRKHAHKVVYHRDELEAWSQHREFRSTGAVAGEQAPQPNRRPQK